MNNASLKKVIEINAEVTIIIGADSYKANATKIKWCDQDNKTPLIICCKAGSDLYDRLSDCPLPGCHLIHDKRSYAGYIVCWESISEDSLNIEVEFFRYTNLNVMMANLANMAKEGLAELEKLRSTV